MEFQIVTKDKLSENIKLSLLNEYGWENKAVNDAVMHIDSFIKGMLPNLYIGIEYPYVDKLYRNSYYSYFSSKHLSYSRNSIRISFFKEPIKGNDFFNPRSFKNLQKNFLGFLVIRPTPYKIIGRNILRPDIFEKNKTHYVASTKGSAAISGLKLEVQGFPHCSQDAEMMVCAETTIWSIIEYFSHKYPDYKQVLPNDINKILSSTSVERQIPSRGLTGLQISYALKELGFGVKTYSSISYKSSNLSKIIKIYIESGIPVVATIKKNKLGHVLNIVGREDIEFAQNFKSVGKLHGGSNLFDYYDHTGDYLVIDDNLVPYSKISLDNPVKSYINFPSFKKIWKGAKIDGAIVPLHPRIYMDADRVQVFVFQWLKNISVKMTMSHTVVRTLLSSSRSFKNYVALNKEFTEDVKTVILNIDMPKFLWLVELSTPSLVSEKLACGMIFIDATEPKKVNIIGAIINKISMELNDDNYPIRQYPVSLQPFNIFHNLNSF